MLLGFKQRFTAFVEDGSKTHTIRARRKRAPRVGELCHCYYALRTKQCRLLGRWVCVAVEDVRVTEYESVFVNRRLLDADERNVLAWADGFRSRGRDGAWAEMFEYWTSPTGRSTDPPALPFDGYIIHWKFLPGTQCQDNQKPRRVCPSRPSCAK